MLQKETRARSLDGCLVIAVSFMNNAQSCTMRSLSGSVPEACTGCMWQCCVCCALMGMGLNCFTKHTSLIRPLVIHYYCPNSIVRCDWFTCNAIVNYPGFALTSCFAVMFYSHASSQDEDHEAQVLYQVSDARDKLLQQLSTQRDPIKVWCNALMLAP